MTQYTADNRSEEVWVKHLEFVQGAITRMAQNSYLLKQWTVTLVSALFALSFAAVGLQLVIIALIPTAAFAIMDAYYLRQERLFRKLYVHLAQEPFSVPVFSMDTRPYQDQVDDVPTIMKSVSIAWFYGAIGAAIIIVPGLIELTV